MKKANCVSAASRYERLKIALSAAISGSIEAVMNPHAKNSVVIDAKAPRCAAAPLVTGAPRAAVPEVPTPMSPPA